MILVLHLHLAEWKILWSLKLHVFSSEDQLWQRYSTLIEDAKIVLHSYQTWSVEHSKKEANMGAHSLVKVVIQTSMEKIWLDEYLEFLRDVIIADSCNL
jgi:hypothetical protein